MQDFDSLYVDLRCNGESIMDNKIMNYSSCGEKTGQIKKLTFMGHSQLQVSWYPLTTWCEYMTIICLHDAAVFCVSRYHVDSYVCQIGSSLNAQYIRTW